jgi:hypothetical protein
MLGMKQGLSTIGLTIFLLLGWADTLAAQQIMLPLGQQTDTSNLDLPQRGQTKDQVAGSLGEPQTVQPAVGEPPITVWEYSDFLVYFERDWVLRAVVRHPELWAQPPQTGNQP